ncbi:Kinesin-associated protein [Besnoitia besnoiti]|uniref:Kinesin-associated protein n=1 Tax=Besnoitia besnoiti TaxID=94643 RepID=A0A2A9M9T1_BESBE|nr:Kinesin-associated protein [Besnoitia besnoiti]PFH33081.1 Kinesin-associated protein [Besnoitia besnoiti]
MVKRGIVRVLVDSLDRRHRDLVLVCLIFLWRLSAISGNKDEIVQNGFLSKAARLLQKFSAKDAYTIPTATTTLKVLYNLSFDPTVSTEMVNCGILSHVADAVGAPPLRTASLRVLYQLTIEARGRSLLTFHKSGVPLLLDLAAATPKNACVGK